MDNVILNTDAKGKVKFSQQWETFGTLGFGGSGSIPLALQVGPGSFNRQCRNISRRRDETVRAIARGIFRREMNEVETGRKQPRSSKKKRR